MRLFKSKRRWIGVALCLLFVGAACVNTSSADVLGQITKTSKQKITGQIRYLPASRQYAVTTKDGVLKVPVSDVVDVRVKAPENIEKAASAVGQGKYKAAIPVLEKIVKDYTMLQWDAVAGKYLVTAYLRSGDAKMAATTGDKIVDNNEAAGYDKDLAPIYWEALVETEQYAKLRKLLDKGTAMGTREVQAIALLRRGDMDSKKENYREAIVDGYLRVAYFYQAIKPVQPEALYKAAECFQALGQHAYAEKLRKRLLSEYPGDPYTAKVQAGS